MKKKKAIYNKLIAILSASFIYAIFIQIGYLGYGIDVHESYLYSEAWPFNTEPIGWFISSLYIEIFDSRYFVGASLTSLILALGLFFFLWSTLEKRNNKFFIITIGSILLFTHPIILSGTNILRQGVGLGFFLFFLSSYLKEKNRQALLFSILSVLSHNSFLIILIPYYIMILKLPNLLKLFIIISFATIVFIAIEIIVPFKSSIEKTTCLISV